MRPCTVLAPVVFAMGCHTTAGVFVTDVRFVTTGLWVENCRLDIDSNPGESAERVASRHDCTNKVAPAGSGYVAVGDVPRPNMAVVARIAAERQRFTSGVFVRDVAVDGAMLVVTKCRVAANGDALLVGPCGHERTTIPAFGPPGAPPGRTSARPATPHTVDWDPAVDWETFVVDSLCARPCSKRRVVNRYDKAVFVRDADLESSMLVVTRCEISVNQDELVVSACDRQTVPIAPAKSAD